MKADEIPQELVDMLDEDAGMIHSPNGSVRTSLARILTRFAEMIEDGEWHSDVCSVKLRKEG